MDLKKLYTDILALLGTELAIFKFLAFCDMGAREIIARYPKKITVGVGEYLSPESLDSSFALNEEFYLAMLYYVLGCSKGEESLLTKSKESAEDAYLTLWREKAKGKRIAKDRW